jgi:hypothetical protein
MEVSFTRLAIVPATGPVRPRRAGRLANAAGLRHNAEIGQPGRCFSAYGH